MDPPDHLPPTGHQDYEYKKVTLNPPVGRKWMLHLYQNPECRSGHNSVCLDRFPKKRNEKLHFLNGSETVGWGIYFTESLHIAMFVTLILVLTIFMGIVFGVCWTVLEHDLSGAWAVSAWISSVFALGISSWACWMTLS